MECCKRPIRLPVRKQITPAPGTLCYLRQLLVGGNTEAKTTDSDTIFFYHAKTMAGKTILFGCEIIIFEPLFTLQF